VHVYQNALSAFDSWLKIHGAGHAPIRRLLSIGCCVGSQV
jgi:hypothetical protein